jgi:hypothetical protein
MATQVDQAPSDPLVPLVLQARTAVQATPAAQAQPDPLDRLAPLAPRLQPTFRLPLRPTLLQLFTKPPLRPTAPRLNHPTSPQLLATVR